MLEYIENRFNDLKDIIEDKKVVYKQQPPGDIPTRNERSPKKS